MNIALIGRTQMLLDTGKLLVKNGFTISCIVTCKSEDFYTAKESDFEAFAKDLEIPFYCGTNKEQIITTLKDSKSDVGFSFNWLTILTSNIRSCLTHGIFNAHPGDLPRYQGNACPNWAIINKENTIALSIYQMDDGLDSGPIALKEYFDLEEKDITDVYNWLEDISPKAYLKLATDFEKAIQSLEPQDPDNALRCLPRKPQDSKIDWNAESNSILNLVRASSKPFSGAFSFLEDGTKIEIWKAKRVKPQKEYLGIPGQIVYRSKDGNPIILCGQGSLLELLSLTAKELSLEDKEAKKKVLSSLRNRFVEA